jgi:hypothetical protein
MKGVIPTVLLFRPSSEQSQEVGLLTLKHLEIQLTA